MQTDQYGVGLKIGSELGVAGVQHATMMAIGYENSGTELAKNWRPRSNKNELFREHSFG